MRSDMGGHYVIAIALKFTLEILPKPDLLDEKNGSVLRYLGTLANRFAKTHDEIPSKSPLENFLLGKIGELDLHATEITQGSHAL